MHGIFLLVNWTDFFLEMNNLPSALSTGEILPTLLHCRGQLPVSASVFGGGNFQEVALSEYLHKHPNTSTQCVHIICASRALQRNLEIRDSVNVLCIYIQDCQCCTNDKMIKCHEQNSLCIIIILNDKDFSEEILLQLPTFTYNILISVTTNDIGKNPT